MYNQFMTNLLQRFLTYCFIILANIAMPINVLAESEKTDATETLIFHAIYSENLREIMHRLSQSVYENELDNAETEKTRIKNKQQLFDNASELYIAAQKMTQALPGFDLTEDEKNIFEGLAKQLQIEANNLGYMSMKNDQAGMESVFKRLNDTCAACHELFRF